MWECMYAHHVCEVHKKARTGHWLHWSWSYMIWVLGIEPESSGRAAGAPNHRAIAPVSP